jgi:hypothetical protein
LADYLAKTGAPAAAKRAEVDAPPLAAPSAKQSLQALGRLPAGTMNKTEARYAEHLEQLMRAGEILWWKFEGVKLRLADNTFLTPDFFVMTADRSLWCHEVKGHWEEDARVKIKVAAALFPFRFIAVKPRAQKTGGGWEIEEF